MSGLPKKATDRVNTYGVVLIGIVSGLLLWVSVVALQAYYNTTSGSVERERGATNKGREVRDLKESQLRALQEAKFVDAKAGTVTIPIESAMSAVLASARSGSPSLVPAIGPHDTPTVPAVWGKPADVPPATPAPDGAAPAPAPALAPAGSTAPPTTPPSQLDPSKQLPRDPLTP